MNFIKTTVIGGLVFMAPIVIAVVVFKKAFELVMVVTRPLESLVPADSIRGIALANILAILAIAAGCFVAGLIARGALAKKAYRSLDNALLIVPGYALVKGFSESMSGTEEAARSFVPVLVQFDDNDQIGFEVERLSKGRVAVYLPGAPNPWSGSVAYVSEDRVKKLHISAAQALKAIRQVGRGSTNLENELYP
jgi:uncharacterized membrane protein